MTRKQKDPLREITGEERRWLKRMSRSSSEPASHVARAKAILSVAEGGTYTAAAQAAGRKGARKGGLARAASLSATKRRQIARRAAKARWKKPSA